MLCAPDSQELLEVFETARDAAFWVYGASARRTNYKTSTHDRTARSIYTQNALMSSAVEYLKDFISSGIDRKRIAFDRVPESLIYAYELKDKNNEDRLKFLRLMAILAFTKKTIIQIARRSRNYARAGAKRKTD